VRARNGRPKSSVQTGRCQTDDQATGNCCLSCECAWQAAGRSAVSPARRRKSRIQAIAYTRCAVPAFEDSRSPAGPTSFSSEAIARPVSGNSELARHSPNETGWLPRRTTGLLSLSKGTGS